MNEFKFVNDIVTKYGFTAISNKQMKRIIWQIQTVVKQSCSGDVILLIGHTQKLKHQYHPFNHLCNGKITLKRTNIYRLFW